MPPQELPPLLLMMQVNATKFLIFSEFYQWLYHEQPLNNRMNIL